MKTIKLIAFGLMLMLAGSTQAQLSIRLNIGTPPAWGPAGYDNARYYYLPDVEAYYDVPHAMFIYQSGNRWVHRAYLPERYRDYDLYNGYKVVLNNYRGNAPYAHFREHRMQYTHGYRGAEQHSIGRREDYRRDNDRGRRADGDNRGRGHDQKENHGHDREN